VFRLFFIVEYREVPGASVQSRMTFTRMSFPFAMSCLRSSDLDALLSGLFQYGFYALTVYRLHGLRGNAKRDPAILSGKEEPLLLKVHFEAPLRLVVGMRDVVACHWSLTRQLISSCHGLKAVSEISNFIRRPQDIALARDRLLIPGQVQIKKAGKTAKTDKYTVAVSD
jgi:hypothetical protein